MRTNMNSWRSLMTWLFFVVIFSFSVTSKAALPLVVEGQPLPSLAPMLDKALPAVVNVSVTSVAAQRTHLFQDPFFRQFFDLPQIQQRTEQSAGSGVIIDAENGYIVTNHHVIKGARLIKITLFNGQELEATLLGADEATDLALLQVISNNLRAFTFGDSDRLRTGDFVVAVGNPFGLGHSVTSGIVSGLGRSGLGIERYEDFIQTDASINPGNSGGALLDLNGQLVGINTAILAPGGGNIGIGFAIPINRVQHLVQQLADFGDIKRGILGVVSEDLPADYKIANNVPTRLGAVVTKVISGSPAQLAKLQIGDIIVRIGEEQIESSSDLRNTLGLIRVGEFKQVTYWRTTQLHTVYVQIIDPLTLRPTSEQLYERLSGAQFIDVKLTTQAGQRGAILVKKVNANTFIIQAGLKSDDLIVAANNRPMQSIDHLRQLIDQSPTHLVLTLQRGREQLDISILK